LSYMLEDGQVAVVVTQGKLAEKVPVGMVPVVRVDEEWEEIGREEGGENLGKVGCHGENAAYVLYTSGTTGKAKGVVVEHRGLRNYVEAMVKELGMEEGRGWVWVTTVAADLGNTMLLGGVCGGGGVVQVVGVEGGRDGEKLSRYGEEQRRAMGWDGMKVTPTHLQGLLAGVKRGGGEEEEWRRRRRGMLPDKRLVLGGEGLRWEWVKQLQEEAPECEIWNHYGPTETTVGVTMQRVGRGGEAEGQEREEREEGRERGERKGRTVPIGRPLWNNQVYVLDEEMRPVGMGMVGELYIGGAQLARGYQNRGGLTGERFVPSPFQAGERLYRTGDLGRWQEGGVIEFLGRGDEQVKIRGYRVELGEVEEVLGEHAEVREAAVVVRQVRGAGEAGEERRGTGGEGGEEKRLVGYVVLQEGVKGRSGELRRYLKERLPEYMVPQTIVEMEEMPRLGNGKLNRRALPEPGHERPENGREYVGPRTAVEEMLRGIWEQVLGVEGVGVEDNFFELGGHSLLATQVVSQVRQRLGIEMELRWMFETPTVAAITMKLENVQAHDPQSMDLLVAIEQLPAERVTELLSKYQTANSED
jgi:amino acid adenylation domain-containing protein